MNHELVYRLNHLTWNVMPYGPLFFCGCVLALYLYTEVDLSAEGIPWPRYFKLLGWTLALMASVPLRIGFVL